MQRKEYYQEKFSEGFNYVVQYNQNILSVFIFRLLWVISVQMEVKTKGKISELLELTLLDKYSDKNVNKRKFLSYCA